MCWVYSPLSVCVLLFTSNFRVSLTNEWAPHDGKVTNGVKQAPLRARLRLLSRRCTLALTTKTVLTDRHRYKIMTPAVPFLVAFLIYELFELDLESCFVL